MKAFRTSPGRDRFVSDCVFLVKVIFIAESCIVLESGLNVRSRNWNVTHNCYGTESRLTDRIGINVDEVETTNEYFSAVAGNICTAGVLV